jgi:glycosyltransferase involved in cell wall biosynthesis
VIAFASGGLADIVEDGTTGYLVPPRDVDALGRRMEQVLLDPRRHDIGRAGRQAALARVAPESVARRYAQLYRTVIDGHAS